jgi:DNA (cytosine-5)-methyltransferase 1
MAMRVAGLFAGIGGIELGLHAAGFESVLLCENDPAAQAVLLDHFDDVPLVGDVNELISLPAAEVVAGGFPCQDLSQAGRTAGINGSQSGLVKEVFRLIDRSSATWLLLENVSFMLQLDRGEAMRFLVESLEGMGFSWAYRVVDTRAFGLPQRRQRVIFLASRTNDARTVLFTDDEGEAASADSADVACGFYWTEGNRGLGWAVDAIPTLKGGSGLGIPSPPAIRLPDGAGIFTPTIRDAERLQGFDADWTFGGAQAGRRDGQRWKMVGNAVSVPVFTWVGERLRAPGTPLDVDGETLDGTRWPSAASGGHGVWRAADLSMWPIRKPYTHLLDFLKHELTPLSERATAGFLRRARASSLRFEPGFLEQVALHLDRVSATASRAA